MVKKEPGKVEAVEIKIRQGNKTIREGKDEGLRLWHGITSTV